MLLRIISACASPSFIVTLSYPISKSPTSI
nr:MAG TPA_asm: hypothetical protein [Bacteriophage sp.]